MHQFTEYHYKKYQCYLCCFDLDFLCELATHESCVLVECRKIRYTNDKSPKLVEQPFSIVVVLIDQNMHLYYIFLLYESILCKSKNLCSIKSKNGSWYLLFHCQYFWSKHFSKNKVEVLNFKKLCNFISHFAFHWSISINSLIWLYSWGLKMKQVYVLFC